MLARMEVARADGGAELVEERRLGRQDHHVLGAIYQSPRTGRRRPVRLPPVDQPTAYRGREPEEA